MMTDDDSPIEGEIVGPEGDGQWLSVPAASALTGTPQKTFYRRVERHRVMSRKNAEGRIEVWVPGAPASVSATDTRLSPVVGINTLDVRELLAPLAQALADSQQTAVTATERAVKAEAELAALKARLSAGRTGRIDALRSWWRFWILGETGDSQ